MPLHLPSGPATNATTDHAWIKAYPQGVDWHMAVPLKAVTSLLDDAVRDYPNNPATQFKGKTQTYRQIGSDVDRVAAGLQAMGVKKGTHVGLLLPNTPAFIVYYYAILKCGGTVVNFNPLYTLDELTFQIKDSETGILVTHDLKALFDKVEALIAKGALQRAIVVPFAPLLPMSKSILFQLFKRDAIANPSASAVKDRVVSGQSLAASSHKFEPVSINPEKDIAVLQYTGGTTGTPKGAMLSHGNLYANAMQIVAWAQDLKQGQECVLGILPFFHVFAMTVVMNLGIAKAAKIVMIPRFDLNETLQLIDAEKPTIMPAVPTIFNAIMNHPKVKDFDLTSIHFCLSGGAPLPLEVKTKFEAMTGCKLVEGYGLSETSPVLTCNPINGPVIAGSIGPPLPATIISLRDIADPTKEVALGERGELCAAGPQVMKGYWKKPAETANQFVGKFLRTGDVAVMDENGFFFIVDRIKDLIICSGYNVYPRRIEEAIYEHPAVEEVTVVGIKDSYRGEAPKAFIKLRAGMTATAAEILKHLEPKISKIEMPAQIEFRDSLPKTMIGKLSKKELAAEEAERAKSS